MISFPKDTEQRVVELGGRKEAWSLNPGITCPYCDNTTIWTRVAYAGREAKDSITIYNNSPHFCAQCSTRFILHHVVAPDPAQEEEDNKARSTFLDKDTQLNLGHIFNKEEERSIAIPDR